MSAVEAAVMRLGVRYQLIYFFFFPAIKFSQFTIKGASRFVTKFYKVLTKKELRSCPQSIVDNSVHNCFKFVAIPEDSSMLVKLLIS
jgi:hypothetical protein